MEAVTPGQLSVMLGVSPRAVAELFGPTLPEGVYLLSEVDDRLASLRSALGAEADYVSPDFIAGQQALPLS